MICAIKLDVALLENIFFNKIYKSTENGRKKLICIDIIFAIIAALRL
jgi:hypothetical protein